MAGAGRRLLRLLEHLLTEMKECVQKAQRRSMRPEELLEREAAPLLGQGGGTSGQGDASVALQSLLRDIAKTLNEALKCVKESRSTLFEQQKGPLEACEVVGVLLGDLSELSKDAREAFGEYHETLRQEEETARLRGDPWGREGEPSETARQLLAKVEELFSAAELYLQIQDPAGQRDESEASAFLCTQLRPLLREAQEGLPKPHNQTVDQTNLPRATRDFLEALTKHLKKAAAVLTSYSLKKGQDPRSSHRLTECLKSVWKGRTKYPVIVAASVLVLAGLLVGIRVLKSDRRTEQQMQNKSLQSSATQSGKDGHVLPPCGDDWIRYQNKCFYFSEAEGTWAEAKDSCAALGSSLALIDTKKELNFMLRHKGDYNHWIGLKRANKTQPWTWVNGTKFNNWFTVSDASECAYLGYGKLKSLECDFINKWICTRGAT